MIRKKKKKRKKLKRDRNEAIQSVKKEIIFLGETPISEFEANNNDEYIAALNKQLDKIKKIKEQEEKEIQQSIPVGLLRSQEVMKKSCMLEELQLLIHYKVQ